MCVQVKCWIVSHLHLHPYPFLFIDTGEEIQRNYRVKNENQK